MAAVLLSATNIASLSDFKAGVEFRSEVVKFSFEVVAQSKAISLSPLPSTVIVPFLLKVAVVSS